MRKQKSAHNLPLLSRPVLLIDNNFVQILPSPGKDEVDCRVKPSRVFLWLPRTRDMPSRSWKCYWWALPSRSQSQTLCSISTARWVTNEALEERRESFNFHYEPRFDPLHQGRLEDIPEEVWRHIPRDTYIWNEADLASFRDEVIAYWQGCLALARRLVHVLALGLGLPEDYFDHATTYPGGDCTLNFYPGRGDEAPQDKYEVGLEAHTDLQILTILWQSGNGLEILNSKNEWVFSPSIPGTFVVNIGDFLQRLTNDRLKSTVHRVRHYGKSDRYSMAFFFGKIYFRTHHDSFCC